MKGSDIVVNLIGFSIMLMFLAGIVFFNYRYLLAKRQNKKAPGYDVIGLLFFIFVFVTSCTGVVGRWLDPVIANNDVRFLTSFVILLVVVILATMLSRRLVNKRMNKNQ